MTFRVRLEAFALRAEVDVETLMGDGLADFFESLVSDFAGWEGTRTWESQWTALHIDAVHTGGAVDFRWTLRYPDRNEDVAGIWSATIHTYVLPGEELTNLAREVRSFLYDM